MEISRSKGERIDCITSIFDGTERYKRILYNEATKIFVIKNPLQRLGIVSKGLIDCYLIPLMNF